MSVANGSSLKIIFENSPSSAGTFVGQTVLGGFSVYDTITAFATLTGGTGGSLDVVIEGSFDGINFFERVRFKSVPAATTDVQSATVVIGDKVTQIGKSSLSSPGSNILGAGVVAHGHWGEFLRLKFIAGVGTSAGALQEVQLAGTISKR